MIWERGGVLRWQRTGKTGQGEGVRQEGAGLAGAVPDPESFIGHPGLMQGLCELVWTCVALCSPIVGSAPLPRGKDGCPPPCRATSNYPVHSGYTDATIPVGSRWFKIGLLAAQNKKMWAALAPRLMVLMCTL